MRELFFAFPLTMADVRRKIAAWRELLGTEPNIYVTGYLTTADGETVFAGGSDLPTSGLGSRYIYATVSGERTAIDPTRTNRESYSKPALILRQR